MANYFVLSPRFDERNCVVDIPPKYMDAADIRLRVGDKAGNNIPGDFQLKMSDISDGVIIPDVIKGVSHTFNII